MQKRRYLFLFIVAGFLVATQLAFSPATTVSELNENITKLRRVTADLEKVQDRELEKLKKDIFSSFVDIVDFVLQREHIGKVHNSFERIIYSTAALHGWLIGCAYVKDTMKAKWQEETRELMKGVINDIDLQQSKISRIRPNITDTAALLSIEQGRDATIIILGLLRKAEKEISQSQYDI